MSGDLTPPDSGGSAPFRVPGSSSRSFPESLFLGPEGVRAGWRVGLYVALFLLFLLLLEMAAGWLHLLGAVRASAITPTVLIEQEVLSLASAVGATLVLGAMEGRGFADFGFPLRGFLARTFWAGTLWGVGSITALVLGIRTFGGYSFGAIELHGAEVARYAVEWAAAFLLVGLFEEIGFRGYAQRTLTEGVGFWPAALLTSLAFGGVHLSNPGEGPVGVVSVFVIGMFLCLTLRRTGNLWFAIGWHAAFDFGETFLYSVPNSGIAMPGHLLAASFHGPRWLTGGSVGPEGSLLDFVVIGALALAFNRVYRVARSPQEPG